MTYTCKCHRTNYVLDDAVKKPCPCINVAATPSRNHADDFGICNRCYFRGKHQQNQDCENCEGRGWVPSNDLVDWLYARPQLRLRHAKLQMV